MSNRRPRSVQLQMACKWSDAPITINVDYPCMADIGSTCEFDKEGEMLIEPARWSEMGVADRRLLVARPPVGLIRSWNDLGMFR